MDPSPQTALAKSGEASCAGNELAALLGNQSCPDAAWLRHCKETG